MATAETLIRAPIPSNYFCKSCGLCAHHWIMDCSLLSIFHSAKKLLNNNLEEKEEDIKLNDSTPKFEIKCDNNNHSNPTECQSLYRIILALQFYNNNMNNNNKLIYYFTNRYNHLLNDYTHILSTHLNNDKEMNDINSALIYHKINQYIQCNIYKCPIFIRQHNKYNNNNNKDIIFYKNIIDTIRYYFLHPFHTGFKIVTKPPPVNKTNMNEITWNDTELMSLQNYLNNRKYIYNYDKFMIDIPIFYSSNNSEINIKYYFGERYYYWDWYKNNEREDWRCNLGQNYCDYNFNKYNNLKEELLATLKVTISDWNQIYYKGYKYLNECSFIKFLKSFGNDLCHYGIKDETVILITHIISIIIKCDYKWLSNTNLMTIRRNSLSATDLNFKIRKSENHFWSKYLREMIELYGEPITESNLSIFYISINAPIIFNTFSTRFVLHYQQHRQYQWFQCALPTQIIGMGSYIRIN